MANPKYTAILKATADLVFEQGLHAVSMSNIAKTAGVGMGTIYNYFATKDDLINSLFGSLAERLSVATLVAYQPEAALDKRFKHLCRNLLQYGIAHPQEFLLFETLNHSPAIRADIQDHDYGIKAAFFTLIEEAVSVQQIKPLPPVLIANLQISYVAAIVRSASLNDVVINHQIIALATAAWYDLIKQT